MVLTSCSLGFHCQPLSLCELLAHFRQCLGQLLRRCHGHSTQQLHYHVTMYGSEGGSKYLSDS